MYIIDENKLKKILYDKCNIKIYKAELDDIEDFIKKKLYDLFKVAYYNAQNENSKEIKLRHVPLTKGFLDSMEDFREYLDELNIDKMRIKKFVLTEIPGDIPIEEDLVEELPIILGTLFIVFGKVSNAVFPEIIEIKQKHIKKIKEILDYTL